MSELESLPMLESERLAWMWPPDISVSDWAAANRYLAPGVSPEPGLWNNDRTPYLRGLMDVVREPGVEEITFVKPTQIGGSEAARNIVGYWIDNDPGPLLWVTPDEKSAREALDERIRPLLESSPALKRHMTDRAWDVKQTRIKLDTMEIYVAWAGSPQALASRPCRYVVLDEVDKYPIFSGREADPISLAIERTKTYKHRRRVLKISTPTLREGAIWRAFEACGDKRYFQVPCPHCGHRQRLVWPRIRFDKPEGIIDRIKLADFVQRERAAWYECEKCKQAIRERDRQRMVAQGEWVGNDEPSKRVGLHIASWYSPWVNFSDVAAEFILAKGDPARTMNVYNSWFAEPFEVQVAKTTPSVIRDKAIDGPQPKQIPAWAQILIATADTQKDHFYWVVRAWGYEYRSQLVDLGIASTFDELYVRTVAAGYAMSNGGFASPGMLLIDSGGSKGEEMGVSRTNEVYQFVLRNPQQIFPIKGSSRKLNFIVSLHWQKEHEVQLWEIDTEQAKDLLSRLISDPDITRWMPHAACGEDYCTQMASEHKVIDPKTKKMEWRPKTSGAPNHWWDCEAYQAAAAMYVGAGQPAPQQQPTTLPPSPAAEQQANFATGFGAAGQPGQSFSAPSAGWKLKNW